MSTFKMLLIVFAAFILLLIFGSSPMDEVRKQRQERAGKKLVEKIEDANKKKDHFSPGPPVTNNGLTPGTVDNSVAPATRYNNGPNPFTNTNPYTNQGNQDRPPITGQPDMLPNGVPNTAPRDDYYPPTPNGPQSSVKGSIHYAFAQSSRSPNFKTDEGAPLAYFGTKVYTFDTSGKPHPMPDGRYSMYNGRLHMVIRGGEQSIGNGDTGSWAQ